MDNPAWIEMAAEAIRANWHQWEQEAMEIAQNEQSTVAGEQHLYECIRNKLRWIWANHSKVEDELAKGVRRREDGWG